MRKFNKVITFVFCAFVCVVALTSCKKTKKVKVLAEYELTKESYAFAVAKGNASLLETANELLADLKKSGELDKIINSFFDGSATFTYKNTVASLPTGDARNDYLVVATNAYFPPFEHYEGDKLSGVDMKIASLLAEKMGKTLFISDMDFDAVITSVQAGMADIGMAGLTVNETRLKVVDFTDEYYESAQVLIVAEDDKVFSNCKSADDVIQKLKEQDMKFKVGAQNGTTGFMYAFGNEDFGYDGFKNLETRGYATGALAVKDISNGLIQAVIIDKQPALMIAASMNQ